MWFRSSLINLSRKILGIIFPEWIIGLSNNKEKQAATSAIGKANSSQRKNRLSLWFRYGMAKCNQQERRPSEKPAKTLLKIYVLSIACSGGRKPNENDDLI